MGILLATRLDDMPAEAWLSCARCDELVAAFRVEHHRDGDITMCRRCFAALQNEIGSTDDLVERMNRFSRFLSSAR